MLDFGLYIMKEANSHDVRGEGIFNNQCSFVEAV